MVDSNLDEEIRELETLIALQVRKLELLRKKNQNLVGSNDKQNSSDIKTTSKNPIIASFEMEESSKEDKKSNDSSKYTIEKVPGYGQEKFDNERAVKIIEKLELLGSNLANERTLLAFIRTALSIARTMNSFMSLTGTGKYGDFMAVFTPMSFSVLMVMTLVIGTLRYYKTKELIRSMHLMKNMSYFLNNYTLPTLCLMVLFMAMVATLDSQWDK